MSVQAAAGARGVLPLGKEKRSGVVRAGETFDCVVLKPEDISGLVDTTRVVPAPSVAGALRSESVLYRFVKRTFDIVSCSLAMLLCLVPMAFIALAIKCDSPGPVLYRQVRTGKDGKPFVLLKFRSMYADAEINGPQWAEVIDSRVTPVGRVLRRSRLDEIPQFAQVVTGKLSLVGPRPERPVFMEAFERYIPGFSQRTLIRPGITGLAQVSGGYDLRPAEKIV